MCMAAGSMVMLGKKLKKSTASPALGLAATCPLAQSENLAPLRAGMVGSAHTELCGKAVSPPSSTSACVAVFVRLWLLLCGAAAAARAQVQVWQGAAGGA